MKDDFQVIESKLSTFYRERLVPLADLARARGVEFFPLGADDSRKSYYAERHDTADYIHEIDSDDLAGELKSLWSDGELPELAEIADELIKFAALLQDKEAAPDDVSPFIYAMF